MAHFRKYYSNSTALSYHVPPVTTVKGILAGLLGYDRDSYYDIFSNAHCKVAIAIDEPIRKITQTMNLLKVENKSQLAGIGVHTQNNTEWIVPENIREGCISYQIVFWHDDEAIMEQLEKCICTDMEVYCSQGIAMALGSAQCLGWIQDGHMVTLEPKALEAGGIVSKFAIPCSKIRKVLPWGNNFSLKKEETMTEFDRERYLTENSKMDILVPFNGKPIWFEVTDDTMCWNNGKEQLVFLEV